MRASLLFVACCFRFTFAFQTNRANEYPALSRLFSSKAEDIKSSLPSPLIDSDGNTIESPDNIAALVKNQRVALYFGASWCRDCRNLEFMLAQYRSALADSDQPIQLIYVPCDNTQNDQLNRMKELGLEVGVPLGGSADTLKRQYGVWPDVDIERFGGTSRELSGDVEGPIATVKGSEGEKVDVERVEVTGKIEDVRDEHGRRSGIPAFVVLDNNGGEFCFLNAERDSISVLADWPVDDPENIW
mmetsp:Transcript_25225/g.59070  ORF Transcript_25225/g.59070 Transcript_25225/m.59070 type:complete len:244 (-) Transcript_25225:294-1025(-)|eukprot:CAMPEP_0197186806 /NCGR_PEP_ID=MMETSP1423-20130617/14628_1 /TAXON_ID=476441 /ORGANISM="Pseudo-nitzschia heimii, Strain UNC1101" /LENGTH=243 /DNA_ID=CAMNT_0042638215 /DNA_START=59 /DNA_END=790 /DNA_ORIENTATION=-